MNSHEDFILSQQDGILLKINLKINGKEERVQKIRSAEEGDCHGTLLLFFDFFCLPSFDKRKKRGMFLNP